MTTAKNVLEQSKGLPTLPVSAARIVSLLSDPEVDIRSIEAAIRPDPALTANILRLANSPFFGLRRNVESVRQAVTMIGLSRVMELAGSAMFCRVLERDLPGYDLPAESFWIHSAAVAVFAERIGNRLEKGQKNDGAFTAGLLHDIGKLAFGTLVEEEFSKISEKMEDGHTTFAEAEESVIGVDHAEVGGALAEAWGLPPIFADVAKYHHKPAEVQHLPCARIVDLVHAADAMAHLFGYGADTGGMARRIDTEVQKRLNLKSRDLEAIAGESTDEIEILAQMQKGSGGI